MLRIKVIIVDENSMRKKDERWKMIKKYGMWSI